MLKKYLIMSANEQQHDFLLARVKALESEVQRLNGEILKAKSTALNLVLSDPNFSKPLNEIETTFEIVKL